MSRAAVVVKVRKSEYDDTWSVATAKHGVAVDSREFNSESEAREWARQRERELKREVKDQAAEHARSALFRRW